MLGVKTVDAFVVREGLNPRSEDTGSSLNLLSPFVPAPLLPDELKLPLLTRFFVRVFLLVYSFSSLTTTCSVAAGRGYDAGGGLEGGRKS